MINQTRIEIALDMVKEAINDLEVINSQEDSEALSEAIRFLKTGSMWGLRDLAIRQISEDMSDGDDDSDDECDCEPCDECALRECECECDSESDESEEPLSAEKKITYKINEKKVTEEEFENAMKEIHTLFIDNG